MIVQVMKIKELATIPKYQTAGAAAFDLAACLEGLFDFIIIRAGYKVVINTGLSFAIPQGYEGEIRPRSGLAMKNDITIINSPGTIDSDYRGEVMVGLINHGRYDMRINHGDRIAQMLIKRVEVATLLVVQELPSTERGTNGFGSTGLQG